MTWRAEESDVRAALSAVSVPSGPADALEREAWLLAQGYESPGTADRQLSEQAARRDARLLARSSDV